MPHFTRIRTVEELGRRALRRATVILDFYADWCVSCKEMERFTFTDMTVQRKLAGALLLQADVTQNGADDRALLKRFGLFGPPGTLFFDRDGKEIDAPASASRARPALETLRQAGCSDRSASALC